MSWAPSPWLFPQGLPSICCAFCSVCGKRNPGLCYVMHCCSYTFLSAPYQLCCPRLQRLQPPASWHYQAALTTVELELLCTPKVPGKQPCASSPPHTLPFSFQLHCDAIPGSSLKREIPFFLQCWYNSFLLANLTHSPGQALKCPAGGLRVICIWDEQPFQSLQ